MNKVLTWFRVNWRVIGQFVGIINIMSGLADALTGHFWTGIFWILIGSIIVYDARTSR